MTDNLKKFRERRQQLKQVYGSGGDFYKFATGHTAFLVCPPTPEMDGCPYIVYEQHFGISPSDGGMAICLAPPRATDLSNPEVARKYKDLRKESLDLSQGCPVCDKLSADDLPPELLQIGKFGNTKAQNMAGKPTWLFGIVPFGMIRGGELQPFPDNERIPRLLPAGWQQWDGICDVIDLNPGVWELDAACLVIMTKDVQGPRTTYKASAFNDTVKNPLRVPKPIRHAIQKAQKSGGDLDLFRVLAGMTKKASDVVAIMSPEATSTPAAGQDSGRPSCFGIKEQFDANDPDCKDDCDSFEDCGAAVGDEFDEPKKGGKKGGRKAKTGSGTKPKTTTTKRGAAKPKKAKPEPEPPKQDPEDDIPESWDGDGEASGDEVPELESDVEDDGADTEDVNDNEDPDAPDGGEDDAGSSAEEVDSFEDQLRKKRAKRKAASK
jgi:hypothetical protein